MLIPLTCGRFAAVDSGAYEKLSEFKWHYHQGYASRQVFNESCKSKKRPLRMHRVINGTPDGLDTDHIDGNTLDNRRSNLRNATRAQNCHNAKVSKNNLLGVKGVGMGRRAKGRPYYAQIYANGGNRHLGYFATIEEASKAYTEAARKYRGEFARV